MGGHLLKSLLFRLLKIKRAWGRPPKPPAVLNLCVEPVIYRLRDPNSWLIQLKEQEGTRDEIIDGYIKLVAKVLGSEGEAREKIYAVSTKYYFAISLAVSEEVANKFKKLSEVINVLNVDRDSRFGNGEPFVNGKPVPYDPQYHAFYFRVQARIRAGRLADGRSVEEIDRKIAEAGMTIEEVEQKFCNPVDVESGWKIDMSDDQESDGMSDEPVTTKVK